MSELPTAFDYIRLGHPLSTVLEWGIAKLNGLKVDNVISFSSRMMPVLAVLRKNLFNEKNTQICYKGELPEFFDFKSLKQVYGYSFEIKQVENADDIPAFEGSTVFISDQDDLKDLALDPKIDFYVSLQAEMGSVIVVNGSEKEQYISEIQHVRRRESIAMTPSDCKTALQPILKFF